MPVLVFTIRSMMLLLKKVNRSISMLRPSVSMARIPSRYPLIGNCSYLVFTTLPVSGAERMKAVASIV